LLVNISTVLFQLILIVKVKKHYDFKMICYTLEFALYTIFF